MWRRSVQSCSNPSRSSARLHGVGVNRKPHLKDANETGCPGANENVMLDVHNVQFFNETKWVQEVRSFRLWDSRLENPRVDVEKRLAYLSQD